MAFRNRLPYTSAPASRFWIFLSRAVLQSKANEPIENARVHTNMNAMPYGCTGTQNKTVKGINVYPNQKSPKRHAGKSQVPTYRRTKYAWPRIIRLKTNARLLSKTTFITGRPNPRKSLLTETNKKI